MRHLVHAAVMVGLVLGLTGRAAAGDDLRAVIDRAIKAHRGKAKADTYRAIQTKAKGKLDLLGGIEFTQEVTAQMPNKFKEVMTLQVMGQQVTTNTVFDGKKGWVTANGEEVKLGDKLQTTLKEAAYLMDVARLANLKEKKYELSHLGEDKVNGKPAIGVRVSCKGHKDINLFFDKKTGLLAKLEHRTTDIQSGQDVKEERIITEYQEVEGRMVAKKLLVKRDDKKLLEAEVTEMNFLDSIDDSEFAKPE